MANTIKGLSIEIGGDTTLLQKSMSDVNKSSRDLKAELKDVEKLLKLDPTNTELVAQKQKILSDSVATTSSKLEQLKEAEVQVQKQFKKGEATEEQFRALQREIVKTEQELEGLEKSSKDFGASISKELKKAGDSMQEFGGKVEGAGKKFAPISAIAGGALAGIVGLGVKAAASADDIVTLSTQTGLSTDQIQKFQYATELIDVPLETLTGSMAKLTKNMGAAQEKNEGLTMSMDDQKAAAIKVEKAQIAYDKAVKKHGKSSLEARDAQVKLSQAMDNTPKAMTGAAGAFKTLGVSVTDNKGKLRDNQVVFDEVIGKLGGIENATERDSIAMAIFGKSAQDLNPLILGGADALTKLGDEADAAGIILSEDTLKSANDFNDAMDKLKAKTAGQFAVIGTEVATMLTPMLEDLAKVIGDVLEWVGSLDEGTLQMIMTILAIVAGIAPLLIIIGKVITAVGIITSALPVLGAAFAILTGPIGIVIAAVAAVIAIGVLLYKNWDYIKEKAAALWKYLQEKFDSIKEAIMTPINNVMTSLGEIDLFQAGKDILTSMLNGLKDVWKGISDWVSDKVSWIADKLSFWKNSNAKMETSSNPLNYDGSHYNGLSNVPFDGYRAILHKNERVLTAKENQTYSQGSSVSHSGVIRVEGVNNRGELNSVVDIVMDQLRREVRMG